VNPALPVYGGSELMLCPEEGIYGILPDPSSQSVVDGRCRAVFLWLRPPVQPCRPIRTGDFAIQEPGKGLVQGHKTHRFLSGGIGSPCSTPDN